MQYLNSDLDVETPHLFDSKSDCESKFRACSSDKRRSYSVSGEGKFEQFAFYETIYEEYVVLDNLSSTPVPSRHHVHD